MTSTWNTTGAWDEGLLVTADRIEPPTEEPLDLAEVRDGHLRAPSVEAENRYIGRLIRVARYAAERATQRSLMTQTWQLSLSRFPSFDRHIELPYPPVQAVESIQYVDTAGDTQTLDAANYALRVTGRDRNERAIVELVSGVSWPSVTERRGAVLATYRCGYVDSSSPPVADVPEDIVHGMLLVIGELYKQRSESVNASNQYAALVGSRGLWARNRVY